MKITALKYGESVFSKRLIFEDDTSDELLPISFVIYLIQTEDKNILVDAGCVQSFLHYELLLLQS